MSSPDLPNIVIRYAWDDGKPNGPIYRSPHEAHEECPYTKNLYDLLRLFVDPAGRIVHSEVVL